MAGKGEALEGAHPVSTTVDPFTNNVNMFPLENGASGGGYTDDVEVSLKDNKGNVLLDRDGVTPLVIRQHRGYLSPLHNVTPLPKVPHRPQSLKK